MGSLAAHDGEVLEDGTGPGTPDGDNLVLDHARAEAAAYCALIRAGGGRVLDEPDLGLHLADLGVGTPFGNTALLTRPVPAADEDDVVGRITGFFAEGTGGPYMVFSSWRTGDWSRFGLLPVGHPPLMFRPTGRTDPTVEGLEVVEVTDAEDLAVFEHTLVDAYPVPEMQPWTEAAYLRPAVLDTPWRLFLGLVEGRPVATSAAYSTGSITLVEFVSTAPEARGRGIGSALTAVASSIDPDLPAMLIASDHGQRAYAGLGYLRLQRQTLWLGPR